MNIKLEKNEKSYIKSSHKIPFQNKALKIFCF